MTLTDWLTYLSSMSANVILSNRRISDLQPAAPPRWWSRDRKLRCLAEWCRDNNLKHLGNLLDEVIEEPSWLSVQEDKILLQESNRRRTFTDIDGRPAPTSTPDIPGGVPAYIFCKRCNEQHIDRGEWVTRLHKTHKCEKCGYMWKPFEFATLGIPYSALNI